MAMTQAAGAPPDNAVSAMTAQQRAQFEQDGILLIRGALSESEVAFYGDGLDRVYAAQQAVGRVSPGGPCTCSARSRTAARRSG